MSKWDKLFHSYRWMTAYRINPQHELNFSKCKEPFQIVSTQKHHWCADPFLFEKDNKIYLFCEYTNENKSKSYIAYKELFPVEEKKWSLAYEFSGHTSYPCIFEFKDNLYMIPETVFANEIVVLKFDFSSKKWKQHSTLLTGKNCPDTTFIEIDGLPYIFIYEIKAHNERYLHLSLLDEELRNIKNDIIVEKYNCPDGRPGGNCIKVDNKLIRVVQPGINHYGERLSFRQFSFVDDKYEENELFAIEPSDVVINTKKKAIGLHTYNRVNDIEVIDLLYKSKFEIFKPIKLLFKKLGLFGFGYYDLKEKRIFKDK